MSVEIKSINSKELWILQTASKPGDLADFYAWQARFELHIRMDPAMVNIEIAGEISGKPPMALEKPRLIDVRNEIKEKYKDLRVEQAGPSKPKGRESPSTVTMEFDSETQKIIDQESTEEWKMQLRSIDDRIKLFKIHRLRTCVLALKYVGYS